MAEENAPDSELAARLVFAAIGQQPVAVTRFTTGFQHFVFEAAFSDRAPVAVRISRPADLHLAVGASRLSQQLRPLGVPLPAVIAEHLAVPQPYQILERLPGTDLGQVIDTLSPSQLMGVASAVAKAQAIVAGTRSAGRYGYAADPAAAPHARWSHILRNSIARSRSRIAQAGLFDLGSVNAAEAALDRLEVEADAQKAVPYLHDTTTKNVIVASNGTVSGIVDVDDLCFGDPRAVIALTLAALTAFGGPQSYAEGWLAVAGFPDDALFRLYVALCLLDFMSEQGLAFNGNQAPSRAEDRQRLLGLFNEALRRVVDG